MKRKRNGEGKEFSGKDAGEEKREERWWRRK